MTLALPRNNRPQAPLLRRGTQLACTIALLSGCQTTPVPPTSPEVVGELRAGTGYLKGYLDRKVLPDSLALLPPPPGPDAPAQTATQTATQTADLAAHRAALALRSGPRGALAAADANLKWPAAADTFSCALDLPISPSATPHLNMLLRRTLVDAGLATYGAKDHYQRPRPYVALNEATCYPSDEGPLRKDGSYPSGHAALGWAWALLLAELAPERSNGLLARGMAFGQSRVVCGYHWQSDVDAGRVVGAAAVARLRNDAVFTAQLAAAREEVRAARAQGQRSPRDCAAEAAALAAR